MRRIIYILFFNCFFAGVLFSQNNNAGEDTIITDEIIVTANRIKTSQLLAPNSIHVLAKDELTHLNSNALSDALSNTPGVYIRDYGFGTGLKTISLNSTQTEHTLLLINGIRLNSRQNAQYDLGLIMTDLIERIEVSKGGSSSLYGSEAIGGVVNLITFDNSKSSFYEFKTEAGSYGMSRILFRAKRIFDLAHGKLFNLDASFSAQSSENDFEFKYFNGFSEEVLRRTNAQYKNRLFNLSSDFYTDKNTRFSLFLNYSNWDRNIPGVVGADYDAKARQTDNDIISSLGFSKLISSNVSITSVFSYKYSLMKYSDPLTYNTNSPINSFYKQHSITTSSDLIITSVITEFDFGAEYSFSNLLSNETDYAKQHQLGVYAVSKLPISIITLYPTLRYDFYSGIDRHVVTSKLGLNAKPFSGIDLSFKASAGNNFRAPTFNELFWKGLGNRNLNPEKSLSFDGEYITE